MRLNRYAHHRFDPTLESEDTRNRIMSLARERNLTHVAVKMLDNFDPNNSMVRASSKLRFDFESVRDKKFKRDQSRYNNK